MTRDPNILSDAEKLLAQAHFSEYQAATARILRFISIQFAVLPVFITVFAFITTTYDRGFFGPVVFAWGSLAAGQIAVNTYNEQNRIRRAGCA
jgi:hypothetical protein